MCYTFCMQKQKVAFFDIDGTIFRWSLFIEYTEMMIEEGVFPKSATEEYQKEYELWQNREGSYEDYISALIAVFDKYIAGVKVEQFQNIVERAVQKRAGRVYRFTRELIAELKEQGYFLVAISHSAKMAVDIFTDKYGFDKVYGVMFEFEDGRFSGKILNRELIFDKGKIVERVFEKEKERLTRKGSLAVGDTASDIAMLRQVERPIAFNPNKELFDEAKSRGWEVVVERKDVVHTL